MKFKETNQICSPLKIIQSINAESSSDRDNRSTYSAAFMKARNSLLVSCRDRKKTEDSETVSF